MCFSQRKTKIKCGGEALRFVERGSKLHEDSQGEYEGRKCAKALRRTKLLKQTKALCAGERLVVRGWPDGQVNGEWLAFSEAAELYEGREPPRKR